MVEEEASEAKTDVAVWMGAFFRSGTRGTAKPSLSLIGRKLSANVEAGRLIDEFCCVKETFELGEEKDEDRVRVVGEETALKEEGVEEADEEAVVEVTGAREENEEEVEDNDDAGELETELVDPAERLLVLLFLFTRSIILFTSFDK